jgi:hypothetical protein
MSTLLDIRAHARDASEAQRLLDACVTQGFFCLDLQGSNSSSKILADQYALLDVMKNDQCHQTPALTTF